MNSYFMFGTVCALAGACDTDFGKGAIAGAGAVILIAVIIYLINSFKRKKGPDVSQKEFEELQLKLKELNEELTEQKKASKSVFEDGALYSLRLLQREGRLIDFLKEDISSYEDAQIGAAVRQIHLGCGKALDENFNVKAIYDKNSEGSEIEVSKTFSPEEIRLTGNVPSEGPYKGVIRHKGWISSSVQLPAKSSKVKSNVIFPAEVEIE